MKKLAITGTAVLVLFTLSVLAACQTPPPPPPEPPAEEPQPEPEPMPATISPPELRVNIWPRPFSPDGDGTDDELNIDIVVRSEAEIASWSVLITEPVEPFLPFHSREGTGTPPAKIVWDGIGDSGDLVQSAMDYPVIVSVTNVLGDTATYEGDIRVDVLVRNEGGVLRVIVPSIIFASNTGDFSRLDADVMENNDRVLRRIAEILNRFEGYSIRIEGHANPTTRPGSAARRTEENGSRTVLGLLPLSEARAKTVLEYLANLGVDRQRLSSVGMGGQRVLVTFENQDYWWQNRRVEFILER